ncbi:MAG: hypothetical protein M0R22_13395 [Dehalococcoidia bacterium]|nr:hypothetical protein [Dehalococcoidia bacterium]
MKAAFVPKTKPGRWSLWLGIAFIVLMWAKTQVRFPLPSPAIAVVGLLGFVLALVAVFKSKDRSILGLVPILVGALIVFWIAAELMFPH